MELSGFGQIYWRPHICVRVGYGTKQYGDKYENIGHGEVLVPGAIGWLITVTMKALFWLAFRIHKDIPLHMYGITGHLKMSEYRVGRKVTRDMGFGSWIWERERDSGSRVVEIGTSGETRIKRQ